MPRWERFPRTFSLSVNEKQYNEKEVLKHLNEVILPYIEAEKERLGVGEEQTALVLMDVFRGQMTDTIFRKLEDLNTKLHTVPAIMTYLYQPSRCPRLSEWRGTELHETKVYALVLL